MFRNLYADTRKIFFSRGFSGGIAAIFFYQMFMSLALWAITVLLIKGQMASEDIAFSFSFIAAFVVTASTLFMVQGDFDDGCIRNKLISGVKRSDAFLSAIISGMLQGVMFSIIAFVISMISLPIFTKGFMNYSIPEVANYWLIITLACMSIGAFSTALIMIFGGSKISYVVGLAVAFVLRIVDTFVLDKLFPEKGNCTLTGAKLELFKFIDRFIPYSYLSMEPHWDTWNYIVGSAGMIIISVVVGLLVFSKKEFH